MPEEQRDPVEIFDREIRHLMGSDSEIAMRIEEDLTLAMDEAFEQVAEVISAAMRQIEDRILDAWQQVEPRAEERAKSLGLDAKAARYGVVKVLFVDTVKEIVYNVSSNIVYSTRGGDLAQSFQHDFDEWVNYLD